MKTKGILSMLAAAAAIVITSNVGAQAGSSQKKYTDDSIVRDLKAGKLTVREAQILQDRRDHGAVKAAAATTGATARKVHPVKPAKPVKPGSVVKKKSKAPVKQLTGPHARHAAQKSHAAKTKPVAKPHHAVMVKEQPAKAANRKDRTAIKKVEPVRKTAVKYIR